MYKRAADAAVLELFFRKYRQGRGCIVFTLADHEYDMWRPVALEAERLATKQLVAGCRRTDPLLNVFNNQRCAAKVIHVRPARWIVHRVGEVADEQDIFAVSRHVAEAKRPTEHAHVRVHANEHYVANASRLKQVPNLDTVVADRVVLGINLDQVDLPLPGTARVASNLG